MSRVLGLLLLINATLPCARAAAVSLQAVSIPQAPAQLPVPHFGAQGFGLPLPLPRADIPPAPSLNDAPALRGSPQLAPQDPSPLPQLPPSVSLSRPARGAFAKPPRQEEPEALQLELILDLPQENPGDSASSARPQAKPYVLGLGTGLLDKAEALASALGHDEHPAEERDGDPDAAARLLKDKERLQALKNDPSRWAEPFLKANALDDLRETVELHRQPGALRNALLLRMAPDSATAAAGPAQDIPGLLFWVGRWRPERLALVRAALLEWDALRPEQRAWLQSQGRAQESWSAVRLDERARLLSPWAVESQRRLLAGPSTLDEKALAELSEQADAVSAFLRDADQAALWQHLDKARTLLRAKNAVEDRLRDSPDPELEALLRRLAADAGKPLKERFETVRTALLGRPEFQDPALVAAMNLHRATKPEEAFTEDERTRLARKLQPLLLSALNGTLAGARTLKFYAQGASPALSVRRLPGMNARFRPLTQDIALSEDYILDRLRERGQGKRALFKDDALLAALARGLAPFFLHEAVHHQQYAWRARSSLAQVFTQEDEIEAYGAEALFVLEKRLQDPACGADFDQDERDAADRLQEDPKNFARIVREIYAELPSCSLFCAGLLRLALAASQELSRRDALDPQAREKLERKAWSSDWRWALENGGNIPSEIRSAKTQTLLFWRGEFVRWFLESFARFKDSFEQVRSAVRSLSAL